MQLTKDDIIEDTRIDIINGTKVPVSMKRYLDFSKFQQVVEFYERYKDNSKGCELFAEYLKQIGIMPPNMGWRDWLFAYCFKDGLK